MTLLRQFKQQDGTDPTKLQTVDSYGSSQVLLYDASGDVLLTEANPGFAKIVGDSGEVAEVNANGQLHVSLEELESGISSNSNTQLNVTNFNSSGTEGTHLLDADSYIGGRFDDEIAVPCTVTEDIFHYAVHEKLAFITTHEETLGNGAEFNISFKTPNSTTYLHLLYRYHGSNETRFTVQEGAVVTASTGTQHPVLSRNRLTAIPTTAVLESSTGSYVAGNAELNATITTEGTIINGTEGQHVGANREGGESDAAFELLLAPNTVYVCKILNDSSQNNIAFLELNWFEVPAA